MLIIPAGSFAGVFRVFNTRLLDLPRALMGCHRMRLFRTCAVVGSWNDLKEIERLGSSPVAYHVAQSRHLVPYVVGSGLRW
jgi:hypothetical protein